MNVIDRKSVESPELDGMGPWMLSLAKKIAKDQRREIEDVFQDGVIVYLQHKHKFDASRGQRTCFVWQLFRSRLSDYRVAQKRKAPIRANNDCTILAAYDTDVVNADALEVLEMAKSYKGNAHTIDVDRVEAKLQWPRQRAKEAMAELRSKWEMLQRKRPTSYYDKHSLYAESGK